MMFQTYLREYKDPFTACKLLLNYPLINFVSQYFSRMRNYEEGLDFVDYSYRIFELNKYKLSDKEFEDFDRKLINYRLSMLDGLNLWQEYISLYEDTLATKKYYYTYCKSRNDPEFNKFVAYEDKNYKYVHFLYLSNRRYQIIKRKFDKWLKGKTVEHLKRHQQNRLTDNELQQRYEEIINCLNIMLKR